jgi:UDP-N-acetylglucosamine 4,6-dehydratase
MCNNENELHNSKLKWKEHSNIRYLLGDIRDLERVKRALKNVDYAFNCAAVKHVPFAENNPIEAVMINIIGLDNIINACVIQGVSSLLHISTDKAVESTCVMGSTKFLGERLCQIRAEMNSELRIIVVRSGNVWNSRGSFGLLLEQYKEKNEPFPLTHPNMKRYFIKGNDLSKFIMEAFDKGNSGEIWVPKLKETLIINLLWDFPYTIVGCRKGEKLEEKLVSEEEMIRIKEYDDRWVISE